MMTYADKVKAEVAARYGVPVRCEVQIIPRGMSGLDPMASWHWKAVRDRQKAVEKQKQDLDRRKCAAALSRITDPAIRNALTLRMKGKTYREIAASTGWAVSKTHKVLARALIGA